jgi:hypothetical protein
MLKIKDYQDDITRLYLEGKTAKEISVLLNFKYHQPVYNFFKKMGWDRNGKTGKSVYKVNENFFKVINTEEKAYLLGFICADGHIETDRLIITVSIKDIDILEKIKKVLHSNHPIKEVIRENPYSKSEKKELKLVELMIGRRELVKPLFDMGLTTNKTYTLDGSILKYIPKYLIRDFLRGYFDGDGNVLFGRRYNSGYKYNINICGNENFLLKSFQTYFPSNNKLYKDLYSKQCYVWKISSREKVIDFMYYLYDNSSIFLQRKYNEFRKIKWSCKTGLIAGNSYSTMQSRGTISSQFAN